MNQTEKTLKLFNAVESKVGLSKQPYICTENGLVIESEAVYAKTAILDFYAKNRLSGEDLNKTFHKSWSKIKNSSDFELRMHQIMHYISGYGSDFKSDVYIPKEVLNVPDLELSFKVVKAYTKEELVKKCFALFQSGIALKEETIDMVLSLLTEDLGYVFNGGENIKNKEVIVKLADLYGIVPKDVMEFLRYVVYKSTGETLLIKNPKTISLIKGSEYNPEKHFNDFGLEKLSEIFNRFKPLFLAFKGKCPKTINKISALSKSNHKPMVSNPLNSMTSKLLDAKDFHWLDNATPYALFKVLEALYNRKNGQEVFAYKVRNGKAFVKPKKTNNVSEMNYEILVGYMKKRFDLSNLKVYLPKNVKYGLPTSEKMYLGNVPIGTRFFGDKLAVGVYWENSWGKDENGANYNNVDLDLSAANIDGRIGWNTAFRQSALMRSGDIKTAPNGAVEYIYADKGLKTPTLIQNNIYSCDIKTCDYKIIIGEGDNINKDYMMNPNNLMFEVKTSFSKREDIVGVLLPKDDKQVFVLLGIGSGNASTSKFGEVSDNFRTALYQQYEKPMSFNKMIKLFGAKIVKNREEIDENTLDFSLDKLEKDSFVKLFC